MLFSLTLLIATPSDHTATQVVSCLESTFEIVACKRVATIAELVTAVQEGSWDILITDATFSHMTVPELISCISGLSVELPLIAISPEPCDEHMATAMQAGAHDYVPLTQQQRLCFVVERDRLRKPTPGNPTEHVAATIREAYFQTVIEHVSDGVAILKADGTILYETPSVKNMLGFEPLELIGKNVLDFIHDDDTEDLKHVYNRCVEKPGSTERLAFRIQHKDGDWRFLEARCHNLLHQPHVGGVVINYWDITERLSAERAGRRAQAALKTSEEQFKTLVEQAADGIFITDQAGCIMEVNSSGCRMLGYEREEIVGKHRSELVPESGKDATSGHGPVLRAGKTILIEQKLMRKDGSLLPAEISIKMLTDGRIQGIVRDITVRKKTETVLKNIAAGVSGTTGDIFFRSLVEYLAGTLKTNYAFIGEFDKAANKLKTIAVQAKGTSVENFIYPLRPSPCFNNGEFVTCCYAENVAERFPQDELLTRLKVSSYIGVPLQTASGKMLGLLVVMDNKPLQHPELAESMLKIFATRASAELERTRTEEQLRESEEKYRTLFEESHDTVFIASVEGQFLDINPAGVRMLGYRSRDELLAVDIPNALYVKPEDRDIIREALEQNGHVKDYELHLKRRNGNKLIVLETATAVHDENGNMVAFRGIMRDVTERKKLEQQLFRALKLEAIGTLAGGIAHDFNNVLAIILAYTELTQDDLPDESGTQFYLKQIVSSVQRARELIHQILTFSRQVEHSRKPILIRTVVDETLRLLRASIPSLIEIRQRISSDNLTVLADPTQIHQVIMNLCTNAYQAMREHGGVLEIILDDVHIEPTDDGSEPLVNPGHYVRLTVRDSGHGMDKVTLNRIFDPFFTTKPVGEGSGMGLAVVHGIVKSHGGAINVNSEKDTGSAFEVFLPFDSGSVTTVDRKSAPAPSGSERILFVDDDEKLAVVEKQVLEKLGYAVTISTSSTEALNLFRTAPEDYDLVITDQAMPRLTGTKLAEEMMQIRPDLPVILLTGFGDIVTADRAKKLGIREFIIKPVLSNELGLTIRKVLDRQKEMASVSG